MTPEQIEVIKQCIREEVSPLTGEIDLIKKGLFGDEEWKEKGLVAEVKDLSGFKSKAYKAGGIAAGVIMGVTWIAKEVWEVLASITIK